MRETGIVAIIIGVLLLFCNGGGIVGFLIFLVIGICCLIGSKKKNNSDMREFYRKTYGEKEGEEYYNWINDITKK